MNQVSLRKGKIFYGWWIVGAAAILNIFAGGTFIYGFTIFFNPIRNTFGWSAAVTSVAFTLQRFESGVFEALAGFLVDKMGPRKLMLGGWSVVGLGFWLMSRINSLWEFYGSFLLIATGMSFAVFIVIFATIANWFDKKRSRAITLVVAGFGISGMLVPLVALAVGNFGWRETLIIMAITAWLIGIPLSLLMRHKPTQYGYLPDGETPETASEAKTVTNLRSAGDTVNREQGSSTSDYTVKAALKTRAFWLLSIAFLFQFIAVSAVMVHIVPYLESVEIPTTIAATTVTGITICSLIGRLGFGLIGDFANKRYLITTGLVLQTIGIFILTFVHMDSIWLIVPFLLTYAPGFGATIPLRFALQADYFGTENLGAIMGAMALVGMVGGLASPIVAGWIFDFTGSYNLAWQLFALISIPAIPMMLLAKPPRAQ